MEQLWQSPVSTRNAEPFTSVWVAGDRITPAAFPRGLCLCLPLGVSLSQPQTRQSSSFHLECLYQLVLSIPPLSACKWRTLNVLEVFVCLFVFSRNGESTPCVLILKFFYLWFTDFWEPIWKTFNFGLFWSHVCYEAIWAGEEDTVFPFVLFLICYSKINLKSCDFYLLFFKGTEYVLHVCIHICIYFKWF